MLIYFQIINFSIPSLSYHFFWFSSGCVLCSSFVHYSTIGTLRFGLMSVIHKYKMFNIWFGLLAVWRTSTSDTLNSTFSGQVQIETECEWIRWGKISLQPNRPMWSLFSRFYFCLQQFCWHCRCLFAVLLFDGWFCSLSYQEFGKRARLVP